MPGCCPTETISVPVLGTGASITIPNPGNGGNGGGTIPPHNSLQGLQGGTSIERYHITKDQYDAIINAGAVNASNPFVTAVQIPAPGVSAVYVDNKLILVEKLANKNIPGGYAGIETNGKINSNFLPSYVDNIEEHTGGAFPTPGVGGTIYVNTDNNLTYRWSGSQYIEISPSPGSTDNLAEGGINLYYKNSRVKAYADTLYQSILPSGANGQILSLVSGVPKWIESTSSAPPSTTITHTATYFASGTGSNLIVTIPHGLLDITTLSRIFVTPTGSSLDSRDFTKASVDNTNIYIYYEVAPPIGVNNLVYNILLDSTVNPSAKKSATYVTSGNDVLTTIQFTHGFSGVTSANQVFATAKSDNASGFLTVSIDGTKVYIRYDVAPPLGTNNLTYDIYII